MAVVIEHQITIERPVTVVYDRVIDFENAPDWQPDLVSVNVTSADPLRAGSIVSMQKHFRFSDIFINGDVTDVQRNKRFAMQGIRGRFRFSRVMEFTPLGGQTRIQDRYTVEVGWMFFWYAPILRQALRKQLEREWQTLKNLLET